MRARGGAHSACKSLSCAIRKTAFGCDVCLLGCCIPPASAERFRGRVQRDRIFVMRSGRKGVPKLGRRVFPQTQVSPKAHQGVISYIMGHEEDHDK